MADGIGFVTGMRGPKADERGDKQTRSCMEISLTVSDSSQRLASIPECSWLIEYLRKVSNPNWLLLPIRKPIDRSPSQLPRISGYFDSSVLELSVTMIVFNFSCDDPLHRRRMQLLDAVSDGVSKPDVYIQMWHIQNGDQIFHCAVDMRVCACAWSNSS